jgi:hypothetical protein
MVLVVSSVQVVGGRVSPWSFYDRRRFPVFESDKRASHASLVIGASGAPRSRFAMVCG